CACESSSTRAGDRSRRGLEYRTLVPAIDIDVGTANEGRAVRRQESDRVGDILRRAPAAERNVGAPAGFLLLEAASEIELVVKLKALGERTFDPARAHGIDQDVARRELVRQRFDEGVLRGVGDRRG